MRYRVKIEAVQEGSVTPQTFKNDKKYQKDLKNCSTTELATVKNLCDLINAGTNVSTVTSAVNALL